MGEKDFFQWFGERCNRTNLEQSNEEERRRYSTNPPYQNRMTKWIDKFYKPFHIDKKQDD